MEFQTKKMENSSVKEIDFSPTEVNEEVLDIKEETAKIPEHRKTWTSHDNTANKTVIREGDLDQVRPRFGATGELQVALVSVEGFEKADCLVNDVSISKYFNEEQHCEFDIGSAQTAVDKALEKCLQSFLPGEFSLLSFNVFIENSYNQKSKVILEPFWVTIVCEVSILSLLNAEPIYKWYPETRLNKAKEMYLTGVELFKLGRFLDCFHFFRWAYKLSVLAVGLEMTGKHPGDDTDPDIIAEAKKYQQNCCNNLAACHFQWNNFRTVVELSNQVLAADPTMVKALYRRGVSFLGLNEFDLAEKDLVAGHKADPANRAVNEKLGQVKQRRKANEAEMAKK